MEKRRLDAGMVMAPACRRVARPESQLEERRALLEKIHSALQACFPDRSDALERELALLLEPTGMIRRGAALFSSRKDRLRADVDRALRFADPDTLEDSLRCLDAWLAHPPRLWTEREVRRAIPAGCTNADVLARLGKPDRSEEAFDTDIWHYDNACVARKDLPAGFIIEMPGGIVSSVRLRQDG